MKSKKKNAGLIFGYVGDPHGRKYYDPKLFGSYDKWKHSEGRYRSLKWGV